jgi:predicted phage tail protein
VNSYQFQEDLISGKYTVRVRAVSTTGQFTDWSELYAFTATGGASIVQSVTIAPTRQATVTWAAVAEADSYEVQIAKIGTNIDFIHPTGITVTKYTTTVALPVGNYRVWVRGVKADGTFLNWSKPVDFVVVETEAIESRMPTEVSLHF